MKNRGLRSSVATITTLAMLGAAAATPSIAAPPPPPMNWTGFYLGGDLGLRSNQANWDTTDAVGAPLTPGLTSESFNHTAFRGGAFAGYNWQFLPRWVTGVEADVGLADGKTTQPGFLPGVSGIGFINPPILGGDAVSVRTTWDASVRARLGYLVTPSVLVFGTAGIAWQHFELESTCGIFSCGGDSGTIGTSRMGWTVGGGIELPLAPGWLARGEYRYADFGTAHTTADLSGGPIADVDVTLATRTFKFGLAYRFGSDNRTFVQSFAQVVPSMSHDWSGKYIGITGGARASQSRWTGVDFFGPPIFDDQASQFYNDNAFRGGAFGGYNWRVASRWIVGVEADIGYGSKTTMQYGFAPGFDGGIPSAIIPGDFTSVKATWDASLRARAGLLATPTTLVYITAGIAYQRYEMRSGFDCICGTSNTLVTISVFGPTIGGGVETMLTDAWRARAEYRYADFGTKLESFNYASIPAPFTSDFRLSTQNVSFGLAYSLN